MAILWCPRWARTLVHVTKLENKNYVQDETHFSEDEDTEQPSKIILFSCILTLFWTDVWLNKEDLLGKHMFQIVMAKLDYKLHHNWHVLKRLGQIKQTNLLVVHP